MSLFAIVPAAGLSRRMGQPKLIMEIGGKTVIERLLTTLSHPAIQETVVVVRQSDQALSRTIEELSLSNVRMVKPDADPPEMRSSVEHAIRDLGNRQTPEPDDGWILIPADHPVLDGNVLDQLITAWETIDEDLLIPQHKGKSGHPTFFRWAVTRRLTEIPGDQGLNWLQTTTGIRIRKLPIESNSILLDLDTPDDLERIQQHALRSDRATPDD